MDQPPQHPYARPMPDDFAPMPPDDERYETLSEREERIRMEAAVIARAREEIAAGLGIDGDAFDAWLDQLEHDEDAPFPVPNPGAACTAPPLTRRAPQGHGLPCRRAGDEGRTQALCSSGCRACCEGELAEAAWRPQTDTGRALHLPAQPCPSWLQAHDLRRLLHPIRGGARHRGQCDGGRCADPGGVPAWHREARTPLASVARRSATRPRLLPAPRCGNRGPVNWACPRPAQRTPPHEQHEARDQP